MRLLLKTLSRNEALAKDALAVIKAFDTHDRESISLTEVAETVTTFSPSKVTFYNLAGTVLATATSLARAELSQAEELQVIRQDFGPRDNPIGWVELELEDVAGVIDLLVLECSADLAEIALLRKQSALAPVEPLGSASTATDEKKLDHSQMVRALLQQDLTTETRLKYMRILGLQTIYPNRVVVLHSEQGTAEAEKYISGDSLAAVDQNWSAKTQNLRKSDLIYTVIDEYVVAICHLTSPLVNERSINKAIRVGVGSAADPEDLARSFEDALSALQFTHCMTAISKVVHWDDLGPFAAVAALAPEQIGNSQDVQNLIKTSESESGLDEILTLEALCVTGTIRAAASLLHLHHSSATRRMHRLEEVMGFPVADPAFRGRSHTALMGWRLLVAAKLSSNTAPIKLPLRAIR